MEDYIGRKFGRLEVIKIYSKDWVKWCICKCDCGNSKHMRFAPLKRKTKPVKSCGCLVKEQIGSKNPYFKHGKSNSRERKSWSYMKTRCYNKNNEHYHRYGGRGIKVCERWKNSFINFYEDMRDCPDRMTLDRIDNDGDYEPSNCRWVTQKQQMNNISKNVNLTYFGITKTLKEWSEILEVKYSLVSQRKRRGWSDEKILSTPRIN